MWLILAGKAFNLKAIEPVQSLKVRKAGLPSLCGAPVLELCSDTKRDEEKTVLTFSASVQVPQCFPLQKSDAALSLE